MTKYQNSYSILYSFDILVVLTNFLYYLKSTINIMKSKIRNRLREDSRPQSRSH